MRMIWLDWKLAVLSALLLWAARQVDAIEEEIG